MNDWKGFEEFDFETPPDWILAWGAKTGYLVVQYDPDSANDPEFPWLTLDGPNYYFDAFTIWHPLPPEPPG